MVRWSEENAYISEISLKTQSVKGRRCVAVLTCRLQVAHGALWAASFPAQPGSLAAIPRAFCARDLTRQPVVDTADYVWVLRLSKWRTFQKVFLVELSMQRSGSFYSFCTSCTTWSRWTWSIEEQRSKVRFRVGSSHNLWWTSVEIWFKIGWSVQGEGSGWQSQEQNVLHLFFGSLTINLSISNPHQTLMNITLSADKVFKKGGEVSMWQQGRIGSAHQSWTALEIICSIYFLKYKDYLSENHFPVWQFHFSVTWSTF